MEEMNNDSVFRDFINGLDIEDDNLDAIMEENDEENHEEESQLLLNKVSMVTRLKLDIYLIYPQGDGNKAYMVQGNQSMEDMGVMTVGQALKIIKSRKKK